MVIDKKEHQHQHQHEQHQHQHQKHQHTLENVFCITTFSLGRNICSPLAFQTSSPASATRSRLSLGAP